MLRLIPARLIPARPTLATERGAVATVVALLLVPLMGFAAVAVDVGALYAERARLQVAADAAALAVAADCARGACGDMEATAQELVTANVGTADAAPPVLESNPTRVTVTGNRPTEHWFAPVIGHDATTVSATATVAWGAPGSGTAALPLTFSECEWRAQTGGGQPSGTTERTIFFPKTSGTGCTGPSGMFVPGGFGWLVTDGAGTCQATTRIGTTFTSEPGNNPPKGCSPGDFDDLLGEVVLLPIFDRVGGTGSGAWYRVWGYAAFRLTGYYFAGQYRGTRACGGNDRCVSGYFERYVDLSGDFEYSPIAPSLGASILRLVR